MTEQEAKEKWCPFARVFDWAVESPSMEVPAQMMFVAANRHVTPNNDMPRCLGSACMAWRWEAVPLRYETSEKSTIAIVQWPPASPTEGHCGLAGKP